MGNLVSSFKQKTCIFVMPPVHTFGGAAAEILYFEHVIAFNSHITEKMAIIL
jgi:hypothetical protein